MINHCSLWTVEMGWENAIFVRGLRRIEKGTKRSVPSRRWRWYPVRLVGPESADDEAIFRRQVENPRETRVTKHPSKEPAKWARVLKQGAMVVTKRRQITKRILVGRWERI